MERKGVAVFLCPLPLKDVASASKTGDGGSGVRHDGWRRSSDEDLGLLRELVSRRFFFCTYGAYYSTTKWDHFQRHRVEEAG